MPGYMPPGGLYGDGAGGGRRLHDGDGGHGTELREEFLYCLFAGRFVGYGEDQGRRDRGAVGKSSSSMKEAVGGGVGMA